MFVFYAQINIKILEKNEFINYVKLESETLFLNTFCCKMWFSIIFRRIFCLE